MKKALFNKVAVLATVLSISSYCFPQMHNRSAAENAMKFVDNLYARYGPNSDPPNLFEKNAKDAFDPSLISLTKADADAAHPDVGALDYDPICNCQDPDVSFPNLKVVIRSANATHALAMVTFNRGNAPTTIEITLLRKNGQWRIFNIEDLSGPGPHTDLRKLLKDDLKELSREHDKSHRR